MEQISCAFLYGRQSWIELERGMQVVMNMMEELLKALKQGKHYRVILNNQNREFNIIVVTTGCMNNLTVFINRFAQCTREWSSFEHLLPTTWFVEMFSPNCLETFKEKFNEIVQDIAFQHSFTFYDKGDNESCFFLSRLE